MIETLEDMANMLDMPMFRLDSGSAPLNFGQIDQIIMTVQNLKGKLDGMEFDQQKHKQWAEAIVVEIKDQTKQLSIPSYKIVVQCVIGQVLGQGVRVASKCLWDDANDNYASWTYENASLFCTGIVFGIYYE